MTTDSTASALSAGLCVTGTLTGPFTMAITAPTRTEKTSPDGYRLAKKPDGALVLQGAYFWQEDWNTYGHEWRDIPTVDLETHNVEAQGRLTAASSPAGVPLERRVGGGVSPAPTFEEKK